MGMNTIKTIKSGPLVEAICYSQAMGHEPPAVRKAKQQEATKARKWQNQKQSAKTLERILATNFQQSDLFVTLTYADEYLPADRAGAQADFSKFIRQVRSDMRKLGIEPKYLVCTESVPEGPGEPRRLHHHAVINGGERALEVIRARWRAGQVHAEPLLDGPMDDYAPRAKYLVKERAPDVEGRRKSIKAWRPSKNLDKPIVTTERVPDTVTITAPPGAYVLDSGGSHNCWGMHQYIKYLLPVDRRPTPPGRKKNTDSNNFLEAQGYNTLTVSTGGENMKKTRAKKQKATPISRKWANYRATVRRLIKLMEANFQPDDLFMTLAYDREHMPKDRAGAQADFTTFIRRVRRSMQKEGIEPKYIYCTESGTEGIKHSMIINGGERARRVILSKWRAGPVTAGTLIDDIAGSYEVRALAMTKEQAPGTEGRKAYARGWKPSLNLEEGTPWID